MASKNLLGGKRILIVDDEPDVLEALADLLSMCDVVKASTFDEAKEKGKSFWWQWHDRFASYFDKKIGPDWQKRHRIAVR